MKVKMKIIGTSGYSPFVSKTAKKHTSCRLFWKDKKLQIDVGNKWEGSKVDWLLITHIHYDHVEDFKTAPKGTLTVVPSIMFMDPLKTGKWSNPDAEFMAIKTWRDFDGLRIKPFPVLHSRTTLTYGYLFDTGTKKFAWLPDYCIIPNYKALFSGLDVLFLGASAMRKPIEHKGYGHCQGAVYDQLNKIATLKNPPKKIYLIHFGMGMRPIPIKTRFLQKKFLDLDIDFTMDGQTVII